MSPIFSLHYAKEVDTTRTLKRIFALLILLAVMAVGLFYPPGESWLLDELRTGKDVDVYQKLHTGLMEQAERIYVRRYDLTADTFNDAWNDVLCGNPETFFVGDTYEYTTMGDHVLYVTPKYDLTGTELMKANADYKIAMQNILDTVEEDWSDLETALYLHDWLVTHCAYDESLEYYDAYTMLTQNTGVCQAYTLTYLALLEECGIPCRYVLSRDMEHSWNVIQIDGAWYNVDLTYDDPTFDRLGKANHRYFLVSDMKLSADHHGGDAPIPCDSTAYDEAVWTGISTGFVPVDGVFYCIAGNTLCRWDDTGLTEIYTIPDVWYVTDDPYSYWEGCHASLDVWGDALIFNTPKEVKAYYPAADAFSTIYTYDGPESIYGVIYNGDGTITCQLADNPNVPGELRQVHIT